MERLVNHPEIASFLSHYPTDHWYIILESLTLYSIQSLTSFYFGYPSLPELKDFLKSHNGSVAFSEKLDELRLDFRKVDNKLQQLAAYCYPNKHQLKRTDNELEKDVIDKAIKNYFTPHSCDKDDLIINHIPGTIAFHKKSNRIQDYPLQTMRCHNKSENTKDYLNKEIKNSELAKEYYGSTSHTHRKLNSDIQGLLTSKDKQGSKENNDDLKVYKTSRVSTERVRSKKSSMRKKTKELLANIEDIRSHNKLEAWVTESRKTEELIPSHRLDLQGTKSNKNLNTAKNVDYEQIEGFNKFTTLIRNHKSKNSKAKSELTNTAFKALKYEET